MASHVKDVADPKGRKVSVDAATTGNALMLYDILRRNGLSPGDYVTSSVPAARAAAGTRCAARTASRARHLPIR